MTPTRPFALTGWHVLAGFSAFFLLVASLDIGFAVAAYRSFPGQSVGDPYEAGVAYNRTLAQHRAQAALGWQVEAASAPDGVEFRFRDGKGRALAGLSVTGQATRPATEAGAVSLQFTEVATGRFRAHTPGPGAWDVDVVAADPAHRRFEAERRLSWP